MSKEIGGDGQLVLDWPDASANLVAAIAQAYAPGFKGSLVNIDALCTYQGGGFGSGFTYRLHKLFPAKKIYNVHQYISRGVASNNLLHEINENDELNDWAHYYPEQSIELNALADTAMVKKEIGTAANCVICAVPANDHANRLAGADTMRIYAYYLLGVKLKMTEWLYAAAALDVASTDGCSILLMPTRALIQARGIADRRAFVEKGYIRSIIKIGKHPALRTDACFVVLTRENDGIEFIDASKRLSHPSSRAPQEGDLTTLFTRQDTASHKIASLADISDHGWNLEPNLYVGNSVSIVEGTRLGDIVKIRRGGAKKGTLYNPWESTTDAITLFCDASSFTYGQIISESDLHTRFEYDPEQHARRAIPSEKDCILIGRIGAPFKVGLKLGAKSDENAPFVKKYLLASDSLLLLIPSDDVNPYYLLAFLCTDVGQKLLEQVASGTVTQLSARNLREIRVPIPSTNEQKAIEKQYRAWLREKQRLSAELEKLEQSRRNPEWLNIHRNEAAADSTFALSNTSESNA